MYTLKDYEEIKEGSELIGLKRSDGANIPICIGNRDYDEYLLIAEASK